MRSPAVSVLTHVLSACQSHAAQLTLDREHLLLLLPSITANPENAQVETMKDDVNMAKYSSCNTSRQYLRLR